MTIDILTTRINNDIDYNNEYFPPPPTRISSLSSSSSSSSSSRTKKKSVSFFDNGIRNINHYNYCTLAASAAISSEVFIPSLNDHTLDEIKERWFLMEDLRSFKTNAKQTSKRSLSDVAAITLLKNSFVFVPKKSKNKKKNKKTAVTPIDPLVMWCCQHANTRRGLEQWSNREHGQHRQRARRELIQSVVTRQAVLKQFWYKSKSIIHNNSNDDCYRHPFNNNNNNNCGNNNTNNLNYVALTENILASVSLERSYDAQVFAQRMGSADAAAAAFDNYMSMSMTYYYDQSFVLQCYDNNKNNTMNNNGTTTTVLMVKQQDEEGKKEEPTATAVFFNNKTTSSAVTTKSLSSSSKSFFRSSGNRKKTLSYPPSSTMRLASIPRNSLRKKKAFTNAA